jgi:glycosyltransferase involved in cell wall biosynthesis
VFNGERTIRSAIDSVLQQSFSSFRVIVIDDGSNDHTPGILAELASIDSRLTVVRTKNRGIVEALNTGLQRCDAEIVARQDADDISFPDRFATQFQYLASNPDCAAVSGNAIHIDGGGLPIGATRGHGDAHGNPDAIPARDPHLLHPFLMARLDSIRTIGGYRHVLHAEDVDLYWRLAPLGRLHVLEDQLGEYRIHKDSLTSASVQNVRAAAVFSQLAALSAKRRSQGSDDIEFSAGFQSKISKATSLARMVDMASDLIAPDERDYLEVRVAAQMLYQRIFRKFHFEQSDLREIATYLWRHRRDIGQKDRLALMKAPFWYYYKPRAYLAACRRSITRQREQRHFDPSTI